MYKNKENLLGRKFGEWEVVNSCPSLKGHSRWTCVCSCGTICEVLSCNLKNCKSTGCIECVKIKRRTHNMSHSPTYSIWVQMIERCHNEKHRFYKWYGARGITVCPRWYNNFTYFLNDMGEKPEGMSLDRIDNDKGYGKNNCKWSTKSEQQRNRRNSIKIKEINNGWIIIRRIEGCKKYIIQCEICKKERDVLSCNYRRLHQCKCLGE